MDALCTLHLLYSWASKVALVVKNLPANAGDRGLIPGSGRFPGDGNGNPLQCSCLENTMDKRAWWATSMGSQESDTTERLNHHSISAVFQKASIFWRGAFIHVWCHNYHIQFLWLSPRGHFILYWLWWPMGFHSWVPGDGNNKRDNSSPVRDPKTLHRE